MYRYRESEDCGSGSLHEIEVLLRGKAGGNRGEDYLLKGVTTEAKCGSRANKEAVLGVQHKKWYGVGVRVRYRWKQAQRFIGHWREMETYR